MILTRNVCVVVYNESTAGLCLKCCCCIRLYETDKCLIVDRSVVQCLSSKHTVNIQVVYILVHLVSASRT